MTDPKPHTDKTLSSARISRASRMIEVLRQSPIPEDLRTDFWKLSDAVGQRSDDERLVIDALCCLLHLAREKEMTVANSIIAAAMHTQKETGEKVRIKMDAEEVDNSASVAGDRVVIHCIENGRLWSEVHGWVRDPMEATTYDAEAIRSIDLPKGKCAFAEVTHVRDLFQIDHWPISDDAIDCEDPTPRQLLDAVTGGAGENLSSEE